MFIFVAVIFAIGFGVLVYAVFFPVSKALGAVFAILDGLLAWILKHIVAYLFPLPQRRSN